MSVRRLMFLPLETRLCIASLAPEGRVKNGADLPDRMTVLDQQLRPMPHQPWGRSRPPTHTSARGLITGSRGDLFDHLVGAANQRIWDGDPQGSSRLEVDRQPNIGHLLHRHVGRLLASENTACVVA